VLSDAPVVISQPESQTFVLGSTVSFRFVVGGQPVTYQWRRNGVGLINGGRVSGALSSMLTITGVQSSDQGNFDCVAMGTCDTLTSEVANLSCKAFVSEQPAGGLYVGGQAITLIATTSTSGPTSYRWRKDGISLFNNAFYSGVFTPTLTINANDPTQSGSYVLTITNACGITTTVPAIIEVSCPADFNMDGGIDGADVSAFFEMWETADSSADINFDGGIDGSDVDEFFVRWGSGC